VIGNQPDLTAIQASTAPDRNALINLSVLKRAGLLSAMRHQREIHYAANLETMADLIGFLLQDCCDGQVENCREILTLIK